MKDPAIILEYHHRHPVLSETKPITLARVPISDDTWQGSIVLHPRYVPKSVEHESFTARVYRRGRAVDVFLEKPITVNKERYGILNYKGAGADADRDLILHPSLWWQLRNWIPREKGDFPFNRCWGAVKESYGEEEFSDSTLSDYGIAHSPHLAIHPIPEKILRNIERREKGKFPEPLVQIVRAEKTNIRLDYAAVVDEKLERMLDKYCSPETFAAIDSKIILAELELARKGKQLYFQGSVSENRFIDGTLTDKENFSIELSGDRVPQWKNLIRQIFPIILAFFFIKVKEAVITG